MKKLRLLLLMSFVTIVAYAQDVFVFEGIELHNTKGWTFTPSQNRFMTQISASKLKDYIYYMKLYQATITKIADTEEGIDLNEYLQEVISEKTTASMAGNGKYQLKIESIGETTNGSVNGIPAIYADIIYDRQMYEWKTRVFVFKIENEVFSIVCMANGSKKKDKWFDEFEEFLGSFYYNPIE